MEKTNKMLIDATHPEETRVVVLRDGRVEEFDFESAARKPLRGNIYLAKVTRVEPSLQAAFVDYGGNRHGFLAFSEIHPDYYQIPMADRQALLEEEAAAEAAAEAEADARAEARAGRRGGQSEDEDEGYQDHEAHGGAAEPEAPAYDAPPQAAGAENDVVRHADAPRPDEAEPAADHGSDSRGNGEHEVEEVAEAVEAPETLSPTDNTSQDALEEVPERPRRRMRSYKIQEVIKRRQIILVQVVKEERGNKGAALTTYLSLAGRYTVLMPNTGRGGGISRKITNPQDRKRLKSIAHELEVPEGMGLIIRTAGAARTKQEIKRDFEYEIRLWESVRDMTLRSTAPCLVYEEGNLIKRSIRDLFSKDIEDIQVAGEAGYTEALDFMKMLSPSQTKHVVRYEGGEPLFHRYQIERQLNAMFSPFVTLRSGGYLVINQTEALVAIDVNSGKSTREFSIEETALNTNLEAAEELSRQLKLRDLAGLIVIDFIDMEEKRNNRAVERRLKDCLRHDRARIQVGRISHFGLLEMSRQRLRTGVLEGSTSQCPHCQGTGIIRSTESVALAVLRAIEEHLLRDPRHSINVVTTADVALYILNHKRSFITSMESRNGITIAVQASERMQGANFAIERTHAAPAARAPERAAVNMDWGFEGQDEGGESEVEDADASSAEPRQEQQEGEGRRRRRRRRGRRDDRGDRGERNGQNGPRHDDQHAGAGEGSNGQNGHDHGAAHDADEQPAADFDELGGEGTPEGNVARRRPEEGDDNGERGGRDGRRGRRRGRRGGRRGRERGDAPRLDDSGAHAGPQVQAGSDDVRETDTEPQAREAAPPRNGNGEHRSERASAREVPQQEAASAVQRPAEPVTRIPSVEPVVPAPPVHAVSSMPPPAAVQEDVQEDVTRPMRKGWWQRRFSSE